MFINFVISTITNMFFNLFSFTYFPIKAIIITLINVPMLNILLISVTAKLLSCSHSCLKLPHSPTDMLKNANIINCRIQSKRKRSNYRLSNEFFEC